MHPWGKTTALHMYIERRQPSLNFFQNLSFANSFDSKIIGQNQPRSASGKFGPMSGKNKKKTEIQKSRDIASSKVSKLKKAIKKKMMKIQELE